MLVSDILLDVRALLDEYTEDGTIIADDEVVDIVKKAIRFIDMGQKELYRLGNIEKTYEFANYPTTNELGESFDIIPFLGTTLYYPDENGTDAKSYYIEADGTHTIEVQELESGSWSTLATHSGSALSSLTAYKDNLTLTTSGNKVRFKVSGTNNFNTRNRALYNYTFDTVPVYSAWVEEEMPSDFRMLDAIVEEYPIRNFNKLGGYKWVKPNKFYYSYYFKGNFKITYKPIPTTITLSTQTIEVDDITAKLLAFYTASWISPFENQSLANPLFAKYEDLKRELYIVKPAQEEKITNMYSDYAQW